MLEGAARAEAKRLADMMRAELQKAYERQSAARHGSDEKTEADTDVDTLLARVDELVEQSRPPKRQATLQVGGGGAMIGCRDVPHAFEDLRWSLRSLEAFGAAPHVRCPMILPYNTAL